MRQHTEGTVSSIIRVLLELYVSFQHWKNFESPLRIDKVIAMSSVHYFLGHSVQRIMQPQISRSMTSGPSVLQSTTLYINAFTPKTKLGQQLLKP